MGYFFFFFFHQHAIYRASVCHHESRLLALHVYPWKPACTSMSMETSCRNFERKDLILYKQYRVSFNCKTTTIGRQPILKRECTKNNSIINNKTLKFDNQLNLYLYEMPVII